MNAWGADRQEDGLEERPLCYTEKEEDLPRMHSVASVHLLFPLQQVLPAEHLINLRPYVSPVSGIRERGDHHD